MLKLWKLRSRATRWSGTHLPYPNNFIHKQCTIHVAIVWYHFGLGRCFKSPDICENRTYKHIYMHTYMTRTHFLSIVGLQLRPFGAQPHLNHGRETPYGMFGRAHTNIFSFTPTSCIIIIAGYSRVQKKKHALCIHLSGS